MGTLRKWQGYFKAHGGQGGCCSLPRHSQSGALVTSNPARHPPPPPSPVSREPTFHHLPGIPRLPPVWFASPSWVWPCKLEFSMAPIIPFGDEFFCKYFSWRVPPLPASHLGLAPTLPKSPQTLLHSVSTSVCWGLLPVEVMLVSHSIRSSEDQPVCAKYSKFAIILICQFTCFSPTLLRASGRQELILFPSVFPRARHSVCTHRSISCMNEYNFGVRGVFLVCHRLIGFRASHLENASVQFPPVCSGVYNAISPEIILIDFHWSTMRFLFLFFIFHSRTLKSNVIKATYKLEAGRKERKFFLDFGLSAFHRIQVLFPWGFSLASLGKCYFLGEPHKSKPHI